MPNRLPPPRATIFRLALQPPPAPTALPARSPSPAPSLTDAQAAGSKFGYRPDPAPDEFERTEHPPEKTEFDLIADYFQNIDAQGQPVSSSLQQEKRPITRVLTHQSWRFSQFSIAFYERPGA